MFSSRHISHYVNLLHYLNSQVYCSDECESLDASTSPSLSAASSAYPSPYINPSLNAPPNLANVPPLVSSALGVSSPMHKGHRKHMSLSSSSNSSVSWSALSDDDADADPQIEGDLRHNVDLLGNPASFRSTLSHLLKPNSALSYARRPSATNNHSTIPLLHRRTSSTSATPATVPSPPQHPTHFLHPEDEVSDTPSVSLSSSSSLRSRGDLFHPTTLEAIAHEADPSDHNQRTLSPKPKRNRVSLPAYFSLLQNAPGSPPSSFHSKRSPSSIQTLTAVSRSLHSSPSTPWSAQPVVDVTHTHVESISKSVGVETTPRSRGRKRDPDRRSASSRRSTHRSPPRPLPSSDRELPSSPCSHKDTIGASVRARLDSLEKVMDWVSSSPVVGGRGRATRRNSSPPSQPRYGAMLGSGGAFATMAGLYCRSLQHAVVDDEDDVAFNEKCEDSEFRGRRRVEELDEAPKGIDNFEAPGYGNGRSGLKSRERPRERGRMVRYR